MGIQLPLKTEGSRDQESSATTGVIDAMLTNAVKTF